MKKSEAAKRLDAIATELKELALSLRGEGEMKASLWVIVTTNRYKTQGMVGAIESIYPDTIYVNLQGDVPCGYSHSDLEPATPKEGEFWYVKTNDKPNCEYIFCKDNNDKELTSCSYILKERPSEHYEYVCDYSEISELRPATEQEKRQLIKAVEKEYNKTFNGKEWVNMKPKFKKGDYISHESLSEAVNISIFGLCVTKWTAMGLGVGMEDEVCHDIESLINPRFSTPSERQLLDESLAKAGKRYNPETSELEDILKEGDLVIAWTDPKEALICVYSELWITQYSENHITNTGAFNNAIKWDGTKEQYERILKGGKK